MSAQTPAAASYRTPTQIRAEQASANSIPNSASNPAQEALRVAQRMTQAEPDRDQECREASKAREEAARLQGIVEARTSQNAELMRAVAGGAGTAPATAPVTGKKKEQ